MDSAAETAAAEVNHPMMWLQATIDQQVEL
jgi:hypothetical protein